MAGEAQPGSSLVTSFHVACTVSSAGPGHQEPQPSFVPPSSSSSHGCPWSPGLPAAWLAPGPLGRGSVTSPLNFSTVGTLAFPAGARGPSPSHARTRAEGPLVLVPANGVSTVWAAAPPSRLHRTASHIQCFRNLETDDSWSQTRGARRPGRAAGRGGHWGRPAGGSRGRRVVAQSRLRGAGGRPGAVLKALLSRGPRARWQFSLAPGPKPKRGGRQAAPGSFREEGTPGPTPSAG